MTAPVPSPAASQSATARTWIVLGALLLAMAANAGWSRFLIDFHVFYTAAERVWSGGLLYRGLDGAMPFKYAPIIALLLSPLALLPERSAALLWLVASAAMFVRLAAFGRARWFPAAPWWASALVLVFVLPFLRHLFALGQCDLIVLALAAQSESCRERSPWLSGGLLALACLFKPPFLLLTAIAVLFQDWRRLAGWAGATAAAVWLPALRWSLHGNLEQLSAWRAILATTTASSFCALDNQSVAGWVCRFAVPPEHPAFWGLAVALCILLACAVTGPLLRVRRQPDRLRPLLLAVGFYLTAPLSPLGWRTNLISLVPLLYAMLAWVSARQGAARWVVALPATLNALIGLLSFDLLGSRAHGWLVNHRAFGILGAATALTIAWTVSKEQTAAQDRQRVAEQDSCAMPEVSN